MKRISKNIRSFFWVSLVIIACSCSNQLQSKSPVLIVPVYISNPNNDSLKGIVQTFFKELRKSISIESKINLVSGYNGKGILLLTRAQALRQGIEVPTAMAKMGEEALYVQANKQRVHIIGNSMLALQHGVSVYLEALGFRYFMPGEEWEIVPKLQEIYVDCEVLTEPDYEYRSIALAHGYYNSAKIKQEFERWSQFNRMGGAFPVRLGHAYESIVLRNKATFQAHPEYFANPAAAGKMPATPKFNVANKSLINLVVDDALKQVTTLKLNKGGRFMLSMDPSDGGGFCKTEACLKIGNATDQVYYLSNAVARALRAKYPESWVGTLAYSEYIEPGKLKLEPNIFVMVTNGFNNSRYTTTDLIGMWKQRASKVGVYEYLSVYEWDNDLPGKLKAAKPDYLQKSVAEYYASGARSYLGESVMGWVNRGPGHYILSKLLWNKDANVETILNDFYSRAFGKAANHIRKLYESWESYPHALPTENDFFDWYNWVAEASAIENDPAVQTRIRQIKVYLHYLTLFKKLKVEKTEAAFIAIMNYAYRHFETPTFSTLPTMVSLPAYSGFRGRGIYGTQTKAWQANKSPVTVSEIERDFNLIRKGLKKVEGVLHFGESKKLDLLSRKIKLDQKQYEFRGHTIGQRTEFIIRIDKQSTGNFVELSNGYAAIPKTDKVMEMMVTELDKDQKSDKLLLHYKQPSRRKWEKFSLASLSPGTYRIIFNDYNWMYGLRFKGDISYSLLLRPDQKLNTTTSLGYNVFYFYVPESVKVFAVHKTVSLRLHSPTGRLLDHTNNTSETIYVDVKAGESGLWKISQQAGQLYLEGVPPYLGFEPQKMLVPVD